jgi:hypothetical protein
MTKHRRTKRRRSQRGGFFDFFSTNSSDTTSGIEQPGMFSNAITSVTDVTQKAVAGTEGYLDGVKKESGSWFSGVKDKSSGMFSGLFSSSDAAPAASTEVVPATTPDASTSTEVDPNDSSGGRRRRRARSMKGGKGGLGLTYYATPVSGMKVAEPTSWQFYANGTNQYSVKGGSRKRRGRGRKSRRTRRHKRR